MRPHQQGLPVGLQIVGPLYADMRVLRAARAFEATQPVHVAPPSDEAAMPEPEIDRPEIVLTDTASPE